MDINYHYLRAFMSEFKLKENRSSFGVPLAFEPINSSTKVVKLFKQKMARCREWFCRFLLFSFCGRDAIVKIFYTSKGGI